MFMWEFQLNWNKLCNRNSFSLNHSKAFETINRRQQNIQLHILFRLPERLYARLTQSTARPCWNTSTAFLILCCQARTKLADSLILEKGRGTQVSAPISHTDMHALKYTHDRRTESAHKENKQRLPNSTRNVTIKTQQMTKQYLTKPNLCLRQISLHFWFEVSISKSIRCAVVVPSSKDPGSLSSH